MLFMFATYKFIERGLLPILNALVSEWNQVLGWVGDYILSHMYLYCYMLVVSVTMYTIIMIIVLRFVLLYVVVAKNQIKIKRGSEGQFQCNNTNRYPNVFNMYYRFD